MIACNSRPVMKQLQLEESSNRVAVSDTYTRAYFSHGRNCKYSRNCIYDCRGMFLGERIFELDLEIGIVCHYLRDGPYCEW